MTESKPIDILYALMCPKCKALVGSGQQDEETARHVMGMAKDCGLTVIPVLSGEVPPTESCKCPKPSPLSKFVARLSLGKGFQLEHKDEKGRWKTGVPDSFFPKMPMIKAKTAEEAKAAINEYAEEVSKRVGMPVKTIGIEDCDPLPLPGKIGSSAHATVLKAFRVEGYPCQFQAICVENEGAPWDTLILTEHGFQVWPIDLDSAVGSPTKPPAEDLMEYIVGPFLFHLMRIPLPKFNEWVAKCLAQRETL